MYHFIDYLKLLKGIQSLKPLHSKLVFSVFHYNWIIRAILHLVDITVMLSNNEINHTYVCVWI